MYLFGLLDFSLNPKPLLFVKPGFAAAAALDAFAYRAATWAAMIAAVAYQIVFKMKICSSKKVVLYTGAAAVVLSMVCHFFGPHCSSGKTNGIRCVEWAVVISWLQTNVSLLYVQVDTFLSACRVLLFTEKSPDLHRKSAFWGFTLYSVGPVVFA